MIELRSAATRASGTPTIDLSAALVRIDQRPDLMFALLDAMPVAAFWKDRRGRFLGANRYFLDWLDVDSRGELIGRRIGDLAPQDEARGPFVDFQSRFQRMLRSLGTTPPQLGGLQSVGSKRRSCLDGRFDASQFALQQTNGPVCMINGDSGGNALACVHQSRNWNWNQLLPLL